MRIKRFRRKQKTSWFKKLLKFPWKRFILFSGVSVIVACFVYGAFFLPSVKGAAQLSFAESTIIYDRGALEPGAKPERHILYIIHGDENREYIPLEEISPWVTKATIAIEDDQFYSHFGFDLPALVKVFLHEAFGIGPQRGGSTITQQLAKQVFLSNDRKVIRKFKELLLSIKLEWNYSKDEILELYLNKISYGNNAFGIESAARTYFGKSARDLTISESSILASIPLAPTRFSPYGSNVDMLMGHYNYEDYFQTEAEALAAEKQGATKQSDNPQEEVSETNEINSSENDTEEIIEEKDDENANKLRVYKKGRKDLVLQRMLELEYITAEQFQQAWGEGLYVDFNRAQRNIKAPHFVFYVRQQLEDKYGKEFLDQGGLRIYTTLNKDLQDTAEKIIKTKTAHYQRTYGASNVAMTAINPDNGEILAYIGGKDFFDTEHDGQVDILTSKRQPGSSFKPMVYAAGFESGLSPGDTVFDAETNFGNYTPQNFDQKFRGPVSFRRSLDESLNIPAIKMAYLATPKKVLETATKMGVEYDGDASTHGVAIGVGVAEVQPLSHIAAYQVFAGDGSYYKPSAILEIRNAEGKLLEKTNTVDYKKEGLDPEIAALVRNVLTDEDSRPTTDGFDWNNLLQLKDLNNGAKTGTSNRVAKNPNFKPDLPISGKNRKFSTIPGDSWTIGFTPHLVSGVWVGNNRGKPMSAGSTGLTVAAPLWKDFMEEAHKILIQKGADPDKKYNEPKSLVLREINKLNGKLATNETPEHLRVTEVFASFNLPTQTDDSLVKKTINIFTGEEADEGTPAAFAQEVEILNLTSAKPEFPNWQDPVTKWLKDHPEFLISLGQELKFKENSDKDNDEEETGWVIPESLLRDLSPFLQKRIRDLQERGEELDWTKFQDPNDKSAPKIKIISPIKQITTGKIEILISAKSKAPIASVEYYLDDKLIYQSKRTPYKGRFTIPTDFPFGSTHTIRAVLLNKNFGIAQDEITVQVGKDSNGPEIVILGPFANQSIPINSEVQIQVQAHDKTSAVKKVEFLVNNKSLGTSIRSPYNRSFAPTKRGRTTITVKAWDSQGNTSQKSVPINIVREKTIDSKEPFISNVDQKFRTVFIESTFPNPDKIQKAQLVISLPEKVLFQSDWKDLTKYKQVYFPKDTTFTGQATIELYVQKKGEEELKKIDQKSLN